ncbi:2,3-dihydro-2,3-dihydroxybenzoate dehydrogenase [Saccharomonospora saliphila]|uniref:2,3-dihydro-2,3-dihydroxybenzoate dehydrogenase n=1 Tax=Saccharomonospora saliphila TaxID=369829 RepID=UPI00039EBD41|nr:2,3-dihydro-2,3-dihydroxybenzoate dehydrogenase [Saccharomonospora saliphila]
MSGADDERRVCLVTGAAGGIGLAVARLLARDGAVVAASDQRAEELDAAVRSLRDEGLDVRPVTADVSDSESVEKAVEHVETAVGPIACLAHAAGVLHPADLLSTSDEAWARTMAVNTTGAFYVCRAVARRMVPRRRGAIVTVASNAAGVPRAGMGAYATSKAAVTAFTKCLGLELAQHDIRCNVVAPGSTDTAMLRALWDSAGGDRRRTVDGDPAHFRVGIPLGKVGSAEDVAESVRFLLSDQAAQITMQDLYVDGGAALGV